MKKYAFLLLLAVLLTVLQMQPISAAQSDGYIHSSHYYAVSFDGEGDAIVLVQINVENTLDRALTSLDFEIPGQAVIYKAIQENSYQSSPQYIERPDYYPQKREYAQALDYTKTLNSDSTILHLNLWESIQRGESTTITLFYKIPLYAQKDNLGNFQFDFKTIIDRDAILIENMRVAINAQQGFTLKGGEAKVEYKSNMGFVAETQMAKMATAEIGTQQYRQYTDPIRYATGYVKTASNIDAFESFHVRGTYGENSFFANLPESIFWLLSAIIVIGLLAFGAKAAAKNIKWNSKPDAQGYFGIGLISFASAAAIIGLNGVAFFIADLTSRISYQFSWVSMIMMLFGILASTGILFMPPLYISSKQGVVKGAVTFFLTLFFLIILGILAAILIDVFKSPF